MKFKTIAMTGVMSLAGLGLIGAGAHAAYTATTASSQTITAGTLSVAVSAPGATETTNSGLPCTSAANGCTTITLPSFGPVASTFVTTPIEVTITNTGGIPISEVAVQLSDTNTNGTFEGETWACYYAPETTGGSGDVVLANELLTTIEAYGPTAYIGTIPPAGTDTYYVVFYAGDINTGCGPTYSLEQPIAYGGYANAYWPPGSWSGWNGNPPASQPLDWFNVLPTTGTTPPASDNPAAASLTNNAEGGSLTVTMTYSYTA